MLSSIQNYYFHLFLNLIFMHVANDNALETEYWASCIFFLISLKFFINIPGDKYSFIRISFNSLQFGLFKNWDMATKHLNRLENAHV